MSGKGPKEVSSAVGGVKNALDAFELPRNKQQVSYVKQQLKATACPLPSVSATDELVVVMHKAFMEDQLFIRDVRTLGEPITSAGVVTQLSSSAFTERTRPVLEGSTGSP